MNKRKSDVGSPVKALRIGDLLKSRRKPILMAATAIMMALAGLQLGKAFMDDADKIAGFGETAPAPNRRPSAARFDAAPLGSTPPAAAGKATTTAPQPEAGRDAHGRRRRA